MVLAQGIADRLKERREKFKADLISRGRSEGIAEGRTEGKAELAAKVADWNRRRLEAEDARRRLRRAAPYGIGAAGLVQYHRIVKYGHL